MVSRVAQALLLETSAERIAREARLAERERCAKIADKFVERTNADIAHAIAAAIRRN